MNLQYEKVLMDCARYPGCKYYLDIGYAVHDDGTKGMLPNNPCMESDRSKVCNECVEQACEYVKKNF